MLEALSLAGLNDSDRLGNNKNDVIDSNNNMKNDYSQ
jgi:hypothetical protein